MGGRRLDGWIKGGIMLQKTVLNIAAGKVKPIDIAAWDKYFLVNLDLMYYASESPEVIENYYTSWMNYTEEQIKSNPDVYHSKREYKVKEDAFKFMECCSIPFDLITCYRFLEHVRKTDIQYFIYLMSTSLEIGGLVDIIVPDYEELAKLIISEDVGEPSHAEWEQHDTLLTYELLNEPGNPHASIWTENRLKYFFELEGRFKTNKVETYYDFDGRNCYLRYIGQRIK